jgi:UDP-N-acetylmuramoyl-tripeptide--D-alanyl-D-alanine ligase
VIGPDWTLGQVANWTGGRLSDPTRSAEGFSYGALCLDSRQVHENDVFVALRGENHDAHDYLEQAAERGARAALVDRPLYKQGWVEIVVDDTLRAWQSWAGEHRRCLSQAKVIGLTGSSGKTTTKDFLNHLLAGAGSVWSTEGNRNNHVGVPWTLLGLQSTHRFAVIEMGMNHPGEISILTRLAAPDLALITDVGTAHVGYLGSREAILRAKLEILEGMPETSPLVLPHDPWILERLPASVTKHPLRTFGLDSAADWHPAGRIEWSLEGTRFTTPGTGTVRLALLGTGAVLSALAALAACDVLGLDTERLAPRLESLSRRSLRMEPRLIAGVHWLLDCYNASPESTRLALAFLREVPHSGHRILVLGELGELGEQSEEIHQDLGRRAGAIETVLFVGEQARAALAANRSSAAPSSVAAWAANVDEAAEWLRPRLREGDLVLLKGSRRIGLEKILDLLGKSGTDRGGR